MLGFSQKEKLLETCGQTGVFSDQILRLRPLNDTDCSALFILFTAKAARASASKIERCGGGVWMGEGLAVNGQSTGDVNAGDGGDRVGRAIGS